MGAAESVPERTERVDQSGACGEGVRVWGCGCSPDMRMEMGLSAVSFGMAGRVFFVGNNLFYEM